MSITEPQVELTKAGKKRASDFLEFFVDTDFVEDLEEQPAWVLTNHVEVAREISGSR